ncbi:leucine rich repeat-containing protein [Besnoitia besnoiti]|uniref:Leucine rich repeat-containing protein n=1 Tax=Besnoitia besnoiti TaxID=94643 RepID=A0A2A9MA80_BESBE|nr:leucine rich repeat-containing protein [Besnoitia besnoiti]PFH35368.1 leucine rich repeat-containing protein [Besnoitia besnoiti]
MFRRFRKGAGSTAGSQSGAAPALARGKRPEEDSPSEASTAAVYTTLNEDVFYKFIGPQWHQERLQALDFSSSAFCLETLTGREGGLLNPRLKLQNIAELDLSNNALSDGAHEEGGGVGEVVSAANGFRRLTKLILTRNLIERLELSLPSLQVLVVDANRLTAMPPLQGVRNLVVLNLAHNRISDWWIGIDQCPKLQVLDMSYNEMTFLPSQAVDHLQAFSSLRYMREVDLQGNPFSRLFPEYAAVLLHVTGYAGAKLQVVDGEEVSPSGRAATAQDSAAVLARISEYDDLYLDRQEAAEDRPEGSRYAKVDPEKTSASVLHMTRLLETALQERHDRAIELAVTFFDLCGQVYNADDKEATKELWATVNRSGEARRALVKQMVDSALVLMERDEQSRPLVLRGLAKLCVVKEGDMSVECLRVISRLIQQQEAAGGAESESADAAQVLAEVVLPALKSRADDEYLALAVIKGIASMKPCRRLAEALGSCIALLSELLQSFATEATIYRVVATACLTAENCIEATGQGIPQSICQTLLQTELPTDDEGRQLYNDLCSIAGRCAWHVRKAALYMTKARLHSEVYLFYMRDLIGEREATSRLSVREAKLCYGLMMGLYGMMKNNEEAMRECCENYHLVDLLLPALKEGIANPLILSASATGMRVILEDFNQRTQLLRYVTEEMNYLVPLLQYLGGSRYPAICDQATYLERNVDSLAFTPEVPPLSGLQNPYVLKPLAAIAKLIAFYLTEEDNVYCLGINDKLYGAHRERYLLNLLQVRDSEVKLAAMECVAKVPIRFLEVETLQTVLALLPALHNPENGCNSAVLRLAVQLLTRVVADPHSAACAQLVERLADPAIEQVFNVLHRNLTFRSSTARWETHADREQLSMACVEYFRRASSVEGLRLSMRTKPVGTFFASILKAEENQFKWVSADAFDVAIERSWTGRDMKILLLNLSGLERCNVRMKVAFRLLSRMADVLEGHPDTFDAREDQISLSLLAKRERSMWDDREIRRNQLYLDEVERQDRAIQQAEFARLNLAERLLLFLMPVASGATGSRYAQLKREKRDAEYWAGRLKADVEDMEDDIARRAAEAEAKALAEAGEDAPKLKPTPKMAARQHARNRFRKDQNEEEEDFDDPALENLKPEAAEPLQSRERLMEVLMNVDLSVDPEVGALYTHSGAQMCGAEGIWHNLAKGEINVPLLVSAYLRCLHACTQGATTATVLNDTISALRRVTVLRKLVSLIEACPVLTCHISAKFFCLMKLVIRMLPHQAAESMDLIINYEIISEFSMYALRPLLFLLKHSASRPLNREELILCAEAASFYAIVARQTSYVKFSNEFEVQRWATELALEKFFTVPTLRTFVSMLLFDIQIDAGTSHGSYISHLFADLAPLRERMRIDCLTILSEVIQRCPGRLSYEALEALQVARVFSHYPIRNSIQYELLDDANTGHFRTTLELLLSEHAKRAERILQLSVVYWWTASRHLDTAPVRKVVAVTNYAFYILDKPAGLRDPHTPEVEYDYRKSGRIRIDVKKNFRDMTRVVKGGLSNDWLAVGWREPAANGLAFTEAFDIIICDKLLAAAPMIDCLHAISGRVDEERVEVLKDMVTREAISAIVKPKVIQAASMAMRQPTSPEARKEKSKPDFSARYQALFIITLQYIYEVVVAWKFWFCLDPLISKEAGGLRGADEEEGEDEPVRLHGVEAEGGGLGNFVGWMEDEDESWAHDHMQIDRAAAIENGAEVPSWVDNMFGGGASASHTRRLDAARAKLFTVKFKGQIEDIRQVEFGGNEESTVEMTFREGKGSEAKNNVVSVVFSDDAAREQWRRALAKALNKTDASDSWMRRWKS